MIAKEYPHLDETAYECSQCWSVWFRSELWEYAKQDSTTVEKLIGQDDCPDCESNRLEQNRATMITKYKASSRLYWHTRLRYLRGQRIESWVTGTLLYKLRTLARLDNLRRDGQ
jgi:DNA-directed RNA polymerase subunit RPC12/RpoP